MAGSDASDDFEDDQVGEQVVASPEKSESRRSDTLTATPRSSAKSQQSRGRPKGGKTDKGLPKGKRRCQGCLKLFDADVFPPSSLYCARDKKAVDNLYRAARVQDQGDWFQTIRSEPKKMQLLLKTYHARCPSPQPGKRRKAPNLLEYKEVVRTVSSYMRDDVGEMFHEAAFIHWAMKPKNLGLSHVEAAKRFSELVDEDGAVVDQEGPPKSRTRVRVATKTLVTFRNAFEKSKEQSVGDRAKKASDEDIQKSLNRVMSGHDDVGRSGATTLQDMAACMGKIGGDNKFSGKSMVLGDIKNMVPEDSDEAQEEQESDDGGRTIGGTSKRQADDDDDDGEDQPKQKKQKWLCIDESIAGGLRLVNKWRTSTEATCRKQLEEAREVLELVSDPSYAKNVSNETAILRMRADTLDLVVNGSSDQLKAQITSIANAQVARESPLATPAAPSGAASSAGNARARLGSAPPCKSYAELLTLSSFEVFEDQVQASTTREDIVSITKTFKEKGKPISELISTVKAACRMAKSCLAQQKKLLEAAAKRAKKEPMKKSTSLAVGKEPLALWEHGMSIANTVKSVLHEAYDKKTFDAGEALIIRCKVSGEQAQHIFSDGSEVSVRVKVFLDKFRKSSIYTERGRGQRPLPADAVAQLEEMASGFVDAGLKAPR